MGGLDRVASYPLSFGEVRKLKKVASKNFNAGEFL